MNAPHDSEREARIMLKAKSEEKNILPLLETFALSGGRFVLVFEYMAWDLDQLLQQQISSRVQIKSIIKDLFSALDHIHSLGILHRDVKPSNILLRSPSGPAFLADFGIAWLGGDKASEPADQKITDVGTTHYRAPELLFGNHRYGPSLDVWAAGCVVAEAACLDGKSLFDSGELGSDLALIQSHFKTLGTPNLEVWPGAKDCNDWGKMEFYQYAPKPWEEVLPSCDGHARDLVSKLVAYESTTRLTAAERNNMDLVRSTKETLMRVADEDKPQANRAEEDLARNLAQMKMMLSGTPDADVSPEQVYQLVNLICSEDVLLLLAQNIHKLPFEARKDTQLIISNAFRYKLPGQPQTEPPAMHHILSNRPEVIIELCYGYERRESAMACGGVLREALKHDAVAALILYDEPDRRGKDMLAHIDPTVPSTGQGVFWKFFEWIDRGAFEACADAFNTFRVLVADYLQVNFERFFKTYNTVLVQSESYVTKRQSIKLLGELLLDRANYNVMTQYVASGDNLKIIMKLLRDDRRMINYEGFHVFKVFVANPNKSLAVQKILINNRDRLLRFLPSFLDDRTDDDQFTDEKSFLVRQIELLPPVPTVPGQQGQQGQQAGQA
ncbi:Mo25-like-domain-containing protein [Phyllosticta citricarpa]